MSATKKQRRSEKRLAERRANEDKVHKQVILDWLHGLRGEQITAHDRALLDYVIASFQEEFDFWPEQEDPNAFGALMRGPRTMARTDDPDTSKKAAFDAFPRVATQRYKALSAICLAGDHGMCYSEVEQSTGIRGVWKRLSELQQGGWIEPLKDATRRVAATGSQAQIYVATERGMKQFYEELANR